VICRNIIRGRCISARCHYLELQASNQTIYSRHCITERDKNKSIFKLETGRAVRVWDSRVQQTLNRIFVIRPDQWKTFSLQCLYRSSQLPFFLAILEHPSLVQLWLQFNLQIGLSRACLFTAKWKGKAKISSCYEMTTNSLYKARLTCGV